MAYSFNRLRFAVLAGSFRDLQFLYMRPATAHVCALLAALALRLGKVNRGVDLLLRANRYTDSRKFLGLIKKNLGQIKLASPSMIGPPVDLRELDARCLVLAEPVLRSDQVVRKGVLLVSFTETSAKLLATTDPISLTKLFHVVLEPSWSGYADPAILAWLNVTDPVIVQATEARDRDLLESLDCNLVPVAYGAGDWVDPERFSGVPGQERILDSVCVANFGWWKRVHAFLRAVGHAAQAKPTYKSVLVLAGLGKTDAAERRLNDLIRIYGIQDNLEVHGSMPQRALMELVGRSRVLVFTTWKEGSSRVIFEAMCVDTPVIVLRRNIGVNKAYINEHTGSLVEDESLADELLAYSAGRRQGRSPRRWFEDNLGPENTTRKLVEELQRRFPAEHWDHGALAVKGNIPEARYLDGSKMNQPISHWLADFEKKSRRVNCQSEDAGPHLRGASDHDSNPTAPRRPDANYRNI